MSPRLLRALRDPLAWKTLPELRAGGEIVKMLDAIRAEDEAAAPLCDQLLDGPPAWWPQRLRATPAMHTAAMVRQLLRRMPALLESRPAAALQATTMAMAIAEQLDPRKGWPDHVMHARAQSLRDHAYVLSFLGRYAEALDYVEKAERAFQHVPAPRFDLARLALVKASALRMQDRGEEAAALAHDAAETFLLLGEHTRYVNARITEAAMLYDGGKVERALEVWSSVEPADPVAALRVAHNIAVCLCDLGRQAEAIEPLQRCVDEFARRGMATERTRSRWKLGMALLATVRYSDAIASLRLAWAEFTKLNLPVDGALTALDLADALLANDECSEVPAICHEVIAQLTAAGLAAHALPALALLREAAGRGRASREMVREVRGRVG